MRVADRQQAAFNRNLIIHDGAFTDPPIIDVAACVAWRDRIDHIGFFGREPNHAEMRTYRDTHVLQDPVVLLDSGMVDRHAGVVDGLVQYAGRISLRSPSEIVHCLRPVALAGGVYLVDSDYLARLRFGEQIFVMETPPCRRVAAECLSGIFRIGTGPRRDIDDAQLDYVTFLCAAHIDGASADVHAHAFAGAAPE